MMKAALMRGYGPSCSFRIREVARPKVAGDRVLVRVANSSINPIDWKFHSVASYLPIPGGVLGPSRGTVDAQSRVEQRGRREARPLARVARKPGRRP